MRIPLVIYFSIYIKSIAVFINLVLNRSYAYKVYDAKVFISYHLYFVFSLYYLSYKPAGQGQGNFYSRPTHYFYSLTIEQK